MGYRCAVALCRNNNPKTRTNEKSVKYFAFPKNPSVRAKWVKACYRTDDFLAENSYICSEHFLETDYERDLKAELMNLPPKKILKPEVVPTLNLTKATRTEDTSSILRKKKGPELLDISKENKENLGKADAKNPCNGFVISYLGVPRLLITTTDSKNSDDTKSNGESSLDKIISVDPGHVSDIRATSEGNEPIENLNESMPNKNVFKLDELCRLCGCYSRGMKAIFDQNNQVNYPDIISSHFPEIKIHKDDILPVKICSRCETNLVSWYQFHKTCNAVNKRFLSILKKLSTIPVEPLFAEKEEAPRNKMNSNNETIEISHEPANDNDTAFDDENFGEFEIVEVCSPEIMETDTVDVYPEERATENVPSLYPEEKETENMPTSFSEERVTESIPIIYPEEMEITEKIAVDEQHFSAIENTVTEINIEEHPIKEEISEENEILDVTVEQLQEKLQNSPRLFRVKSREILKGTARRRRRRRIPTLNLRRMCHICGKIFKYPESLRRHLKTVHSDERPFKCHLCTSSFNRNHNLTIHIKVVHQHQRVYVKKHVQRLCDYCGKVLLSARSLEEHISSIHTKKALYECDKCHSTFYRKLSYDKHRTSDECDLENPKKCNAPKNEEVFLKYCEFCGLEFKKEHFYLKHQSKHMNNFVCSVCSVNFEDGNLLKEHIDSEHPEMKPFECEVCGKKFKNKPLLNCHLVIHTGEKRYQCQYCSIKFLKKKYLSTHILTHTGERPFVCTICGKGFKQSGDMRKHKATHIRRQI